MNTLLKSLSILFVLEKGDRHLYESKRCLSLFTHNIDETLYTYDGNLSAYFPETSYAPTAISDNYVVGLSYDDVAYCVWNDVWDNVNEYNEAQVYAGISWPIGGGNGTVIGGIVGYNGTPDNGGGDIDEPITTAYKVNNSGQTLSGPDAYGTPVDLNNAGTIVSYHVTYSGANTITSEIVEGVQTLATFTNNIANPVVTPVKINNATPYGQVLDSNGWLWTYDNTSAKYHPVNIADYAPGPDNSSWADVSFPYSGAGDPYPSPLNDTGCLIGTALNTSDGQSHGIVMIPCQFSLLNGAQSGPDGKFFDGTRPTTVSALQNYTSSSFVEETTNSQDGYDILGPLPFGNGQTGEEGDVCVDSIVVIAKVMPSTANVTYGWSRFVQDADVAITHTSTNTWYVNSIPGSSLPPPTNNDTGPSTFYTVVPSTNSNIIAYSDGPGIDLLPWVDQCGVGDFAYHKDHFTYYLTNSVGSASAVATFPIGQVMVCQRIHTDHTEPPVAADWTNVINITSTTNIPDCNGYTTNEIRQIVGPGDPIIFDHSVPVNQ